MMMRTFRAQRGIASAVVGLIASATSKRPAARPSTAT
jgi:hypothetical protein